METSDTSKLKREFNILHEGNSLAKKEAIVQLYEKLNTNKGDLSNKEYENLFKQNIRIILECFNDKSDLVRENASRILYLFISRTNQLHDIIELVYEKLIERSNCKDLEGISHLPEQMRPTKNQKPHVVINVIETIEEIRMIYLDILKDIIESADEDIIIHYMSETVDLVRVFLMDKELKIQIKACEVLTDFIDRYKQYLPNFAEIICQALLLPLVSKKFKVRIVALRALKELLYVGPFKQSVSL